MHHAFLRSFPIWRFQFYIFSSDNWERVFLSSIACYIIFNFLSFSVTNTMTKCHSWNERIYLFFRLWSIIEGRQVRSSCVNYTWCHYCICFCTKYKNCHDKGVSKLWRMLFVDDPCWAHFLISSIPKVQGIVLPWV